MSTDQTPPAVDEDELERLMADQQAVREGANQGTPPGFSSTWTPPAEPAEKEAES